MWRGFLGVALLAAGGPPVPVPGAVREFVVHSAIRPANWDIYLFEKPGSPGRPLTTDPGLDYNAVFSPDGRFVVFVSERSGSADLYALDLKTTGAPRRLTESAAMEDAPDFSPDGRSLLYVGTRDGNADIFVMPFAPEGAGAPARIVNLTRHEGGDFNPAFSPDGRWIAFSSNRDSLRYLNTGSPPEDYQAADIYVMRSDGSGVRRLTREPAWDGSPAWSPDGAAIYYYSERDGRPRIYRMGPDGSDPRPVSAPEAAALSPAFFRDGRLLYSARRGGQSSIVSTTQDGDDPRLESDGQRDYWAPAGDARTGRIVAHGPGPLDAADTFRAEVPGPFRIKEDQTVDLPDRNLRVAAVRAYFPALNPATGEIAANTLFEDVVISLPDGSGRREAFRHPGESVWRPTWTGDGSWLAATVGPPFGSLDENADIWKFRPDGREAINLTPASRANDAFPDFSPDGRTIVFRSSRDGNHEIYLMGSDGSNVRRLTRHDATDTMPAFSPRGDRIAFASNRDGNYEIYLLGIDPAGRPGDLRRITRHPGLDTHPRFSPDGAWVAFASERGGLNDERPLIPVFNVQPYGEIFAIRIEDGTHARLTHNKWEDGLPAWGALPGPRPGRGRRQ